MGGAGMIPELIGIATVGVALAGLALVLNRERRAEMKDLRGEIKDMRGEIREDMDKRFEAVHAEIKELREDTNQQFEAVRGEIGSLRGEMAKLRERMARIEGMFEGFLRRESRQAREPRRESEPAAA